MIIKNNLEVNRFLWAKNAVAEIVTENVPKKLILFDVGAGMEVMRKEYGSLDIEYHSFDIEPKLPTTLYWNISDPFPHESPPADIITMLEVVEHLNNPWMSIKNIAGMLNPEGYLLLTTPNPLWSNARIEMFTKGALTCFTQNDLDRNHHVFTPWPHIIEKLLIDNGFKIIAYHTLDGKTKWFDKNTSLIRLPLQLGFRGIKKML
jgi:hypothetical protein